MVVPIYSFLKVARSPLGLEEYSRTGGTVPILPILPIVCRTLVETNIWQRKESGIGMSWHLMTKNKKSGREDRVLLDKKKVHLIRKYFNR